MRFKPIDIEHAWRHDVFEDAWRGIQNPFVCHFGSSQKSTTQTTTQNSEPWSQQQPYLTTGFSRAQNLLNQPPPTQSFPVAGFNGAQTGALAGIENQAAYGSPIVNSSLGFANDLENGTIRNNNPSNGYFASLADPNSTANKALTGYANGSMLGSNGSDAVAKTISSQIIPQVASSFNRGNSINNPTAAYTAANGITSALAPIEYQNYQTQEGLQQAAATQLNANKQQAGTGIGTNYNTGVTAQVQGNALAPQNQQLGYSDLQQLFNAGTAQQTQAQNEASGAAQASNYAQLSPYQQLQAYMQAVTGNYGGSSTGSQTTPYFQNNTANTLGAISGGASAIGAVLPFLSFL